MGVGVVVVVEEGGRGGCWVRWPRPEGGDAFLGEREDARE